MNLIGFIVCGDMINLYNIIYNRWILGWSNLRIVDRVILTSSDLELKLKELKNIMKDYILLPIGRHMSLFPPPYIFSGKEAVIIELSNLNQIDFFQNIVNVDAGVSYKEVFETCLKKNLFLPLAPPISIFESFGGIYSTGLVSPWYGMPLDSLISEKKVFTFNEKRIYNSFGRNGIVLSFSIKCFSLEESIPLYTKLVVKDIDQIFSLLRKLFFRYKLFPRILIGYMDTDVLELFISFAPKLYKIFIEKIDKEPDIYNLSPLYNLPNLYPKILDTGEYENEKYIYLTSIQNSSFFKDLLKKKCKVLYIDLLKKIAVIDCLKKFRNYRRRIFVKEGFITRVDYRDVQYK